MSKFHKKPEENGTKRKSLEKKKSSPRRSEKKPEKIRYRLTTLAVDGKDISRKVADSEAHIESRKVRLCL
jgi:hypothetical protein